MWEYSEKVKEHFMNPRNVGEIPNADAVGEVGNIACGDALVLYLKIDKKTDKILDAKFQTFGCASAIASSSALTEMIIGLTIDEALKITEDDIARYLDGLPEAKMHCSVMGRDALEAAVNKYRGEKIEATHEDEGKIVCTCFGVTDKKILRAIKEHNLKTAEQVTYYTKAGGGCGGCIPEIEDLIAQVHQEEATIAKSEKEPKPQVLTNIQKIKMIEEVINTEIKPMLQKDGGDIELIDIEGDKVLVALRGACSQCVGAVTTLKNFVEKKLQEYVSDSIFVEEVKG